MIYHYNNTDDSEEPRLSETNIDMSEGDWWCRIRNSIHCVISGNRPRSRMITKTILDTRCKISAIGSIWFSMRCCTPSVWWTGTIVLTIRRTSGTASSTTITSSRCCDRIPGLGKSIIPLPRSKENSSPFLVSPIPTWNGALITSGNPVWKGICCEEVGTTYIEK